MRHILKNPFFKTAIALLLIVILIFAEKSRSTNGFTVKYFSVENEKIPKSFDNYRILLISDYHNKNDGSENDDIVNKAAEISPDIVLLCGDMIDTGDDNDEAFFDLAKKITEKHTTYYVFGNHELALDEQRQNNIRQKMSEYGIVLLENDKVEIYRNNEKIELYGMYFNFAYYHNFMSNKQNFLEYKIDDIKTDLGIADSGSFNILLTHNPYFFETYAEWGADLSLCGHTHGGLIRLPLVGGVFSLAKGLFPKYDAGEFEIDGKEMIITTGMGTDGTGIRFFNKCEMAVIDLKKP